MSDRFDELVEKVRNMPQPTERERQEQALSFTRGNLSFSTNHKPSRKAFVDLAQSRYGWTADEAEAWAAQYTWEVS